jgi:hypothetical protein
MVESKNVLRFVEKESPKRVLSHVTAPKPVQILKDWVRPEMAKGQKEEKEKQQEQIESEREDLQKEIMDKVLDRHTSNEDLAEFLDFIRKRKQTINQ